MNFIGFDTISLLILLGLRTLSGDEGGEEGTFGGFIVFLVIFGRSVAISSYRGPAIGSGSCCDQKKREGDGVDGIKARRS